MAPFLTKTPCYRLFEITVSMSLINFLTRLELAGIMKIKKINFMEKMSPFQHYLESYPIGVHKNYSMI